MSNCAVYCQMGSQAKIPRKRSVVEMLDLQKMNDKFDKNGTKMRDKIDEPAAMGEEREEEGSAGRG